MPTVIDVARHAGVSPASVSRVINGLASVAPEIRSRVQRSMSELGYRPNLVAQGLRRGQTNTVALLVGDLAQRHFAELTLRVQAVLERGGIDLLLFNLGHSAERLEAFLERAGGMQLRGVVLALSDPVPRRALGLLAALQRRGLSVVSVGQDHARQGIPSIAHEERAAAQRAVDYLVGKGHRRIAYVGRIKGSAVGSERFKGYRAALVKAGLFHDELVWDMAFRYTAGHDAVLRALAAGLDFTAVQAGSDEIATGAIAALQDQGLHVPRDVAVIGFGNIEMGAYLRPALTSLSTHPEDAAEHLGELFKGPGLPPARLTLLPRELVVRDSA